MPQKRRKHSSEFKIEAVKLVTEQDYTIAEAAESLGVHPNLLAKWKQKFAPEGKVDEPAIGEKARLEEEVKRLRKENARLLMEREILKKATAFFAKEND